MKNHPDVGSACRKQRMCGSMRFVITWLLVVAAIAGGARAGEGLIGSPEPAGAGVASMARAEAGRHF